MKVIRRHSLEEGIEYVLAQGALESTWRAQVQRAWGAYDERVLHDEEWEKEFETGVLGPAWHSMILRSGTVVAHCALIPVGYTINGSKTRGARPEALFVAESERTSVVSYKGGVRPYVYVLIEETLKAAKEVGCFFGLFAATAQATRLWKMAGCGSKEVEMAGAILVVDWLLQRKTANRRFTPKDLLLHGAFKLYTWGLDWLGALVGARFPVRAVGSFGSSVDERLLPHLTDNHSGILASSAYLNSRLWGDGYLRIEFGEPLMGYLVIRQPSQKSSFHSVLVDYYAREESLDFRACLRLGKALRRLLRQHGIGAATLNIFFAADNSWLWSKILRRLGFVFVGKRSHHTLLYYDNGGIVSFDGSWHITNLFQERF